MPQASSAVYLCHHTQPHLNVKILLFHNPIFVGIPTDLFASLTPAVHIFAFEYFTCWPV